MNFEQGTKLLNLLEEHNTLLKAQNEILEEIEKDLDKIYGGMP